MDALNDTADEVRATDSVDYNPLRGTSATLRFAAVPRRGLPVPAYSVGIGI
jgi:hypothetical protein